MSDRDTGEGLDRIPAGSTGPARQLADPALRPTFDGGEPLTVRRDSLGVREKGDNGESGSFEQGPARRWVDLLETQDQLHSPRGIAGRVGKHR